MEAVFIDGKPAKITVFDFRRYHLQSFPKLSESKHDGLISEAIDAVYDIFYGVATGWDMHKPQVWFDKTRRCYLLLTAWYIADRYPAFVAGVPGMGGLPLKRKKIGSVDLTFADGAIDPASQMKTALRSNVWGSQALIMIETMPRKFLLRNARWV
jgi:hypothetical protein